MNDYTLPAEKVAELRTAHRNTRDKREADRIKSVLTLAGGWSAENVTEILQVDDNTVRNHFKRCRQGGIEAIIPLSAAALAPLTRNSRAILDAHLQERLYVSAKSVAHWVEETFGVSYTVHYTTQRAA